MNTFLINFAVQLPEIRELLNWKQIDLANKTGISRATIIAIENTPTKLTKTMALAIFSVILYELEQRTCQYGELNFNDIKNDSENFLNKLFSLGIMGSKIAIPLLGISAPFAGGFLMGAMSGALMDFFRKPNKATAISIDPNILKLYIDESLKYVNNTTRQKLGIESLEIRSFIDQLEKHES